MRKGWVLVKMEVSNRKNKKYAATIRRGTATRVVHFGHSAYPQYRDSTRLGKYKAKNHMDPKRRRAYFMRHSGVPTKEKALQKTKKFSARYFSHRYLW
jgi:hypothetical protein